MIKTNKKKTKITNWMKLASCYVHWCSFIAPSYFSSFKIVMMKNVMCTCTFPFHHFFAGPGSHHTRPGIGLPSASHYSRSKSHTHIHLQSTSIRCSYQRNIIAHIIAHTHRHAEHRQIIISLSFFRGTHWTVWALSQSEAWRRPKRL